jgi:hypothetical protein
MEKSRAEFLIDQLNNSKTPYTWKYLYDSELFELAVAGDKIAEKYLLGGCGNIEVSKK